MEYTKRGADVCSLRSVGGCRDTDVIIPERVWLKGQVTEIDNFAFRNNRQLKSVVIPEGVVSIGDYAFSGCTGLERVVLPQSLKTIGRGAFMNCDGLTDILLPPSVTAIDHETFACCHSLRRMDLRHVRSFGMGAFAKCEMLTDIAISDETDHIHATTFRDSGYANTHSNWQGGLLYLGKTVIGCNGSLDEYVIRRDTVGIAADVFFEDQHVKRTKNPTYAYLEEEFQMALECPQMPLPDLSGVPEYLEEIVPVKIRFEGTSEEWRKINRRQGEKRISALVITEDGTIQTGF